MAKLKLVADPTFSAMVKIPVPGKPEPEEVLFTFKHRTRTQLDEHFMAIGKRNAATGEGGIPRDQEVKDIMDVATGWDLAEPFTAENVGTFLDNYHRAGWEIGTAYVRELMQAKEGN